MIEVVTKHEIIKEVILEMMTKNKDILFDACVRDCATVELVLRDKYVALHHKAKKDISFDLTTQILVSPEVSAFLCYDNGLNAFLKYDDGDDDFVLYE